MIWSGHRNEPSPEVLYWEEGGRLFGVYGSAEGMIGRWRGEEPFELDRVPLNSRKIAGNPTHRSQP